MVEGYIRTYVAVFTVSYCTNTFLEGGLGVPVVCLLVEGGANCLDQLIESTCNGSPLLICEGTGRVADLLAESIRKYKRIQ